MVAILKIAAPDPQLVAWAKIRASKMTFDGRDSSASRRYMQDCQHYHGPTECSILFTRDTGHHTSGWWKNPDYERCFHLSLSFVAFEHGRSFRLPFSAKTAEKWARAFFGEDVRSVWVEPPYTDAGKAAGVHHYRLFCDEAWKPAKPRGEVYSTDWTPADWKSFSDVHGTPAEIGGA